MVGVYLVYTGSLSLSPRFNYIIFRVANSSFVLLYSKIYFLSLPLYLNNITLHSHNFISLNSSNYDNLNWSQFDINSKLSSFFFLCYLRFLFYGKGYRLVTNERLTFAFNFGYSHIYYIYNRTSIPIMFFKTRWILVGLNSFAFNAVKTSLFRSKPTNIFTGRGMRFRKKLMRKKAGKISMYM